MKSIFASILILLFGLGFLNAQVVTSDPAIPIDSSPLTIYFDATKGSGGLAGYTGDVYAHTGVLTNLSSGGTDWRYVKTGWGENTSETKLTKVSENLYSLAITPSIREYYGVPLNETITHCAFVFRDTTGSKTGKDANGGDLFVEVFEEGLNISISSPEQNTLINKGQPVFFEAVSSESATLDLFLNSSVVKSEITTSISHTFFFSESGDYWIKVSATLIDETVSDSVFIHVLDDQIDELLPVGSKDGINYIDDQTVNLVLHAPGKESVFVIGDFNNWTPGSDARMKKDNDKFWISINTLEPGKEYAYQYLIDGELYIADPYSEKILDPFNDKWISTDTYPNLKPYPSDYTSGIVGVLQTSQAPYVWQSTTFTPPENGDLIIYEMLVRDFIENHDWLTLTDTLNYLSTLGINAIELMPINEFEGNESWGYNPSFYLALDKYYGPEEDLKVFIDSCHARGMAVIMDIALNHSYSQSPLVQLYYDGSTGKVSANNPWYNVDSPNAVYSWGFDFNHESTATQYFVDRVNEYWLTEFKVDGFRFDFTKGFTNTPGDGGAYDATRIAILKRMANKIWSVNPESYIILEHFADNSEEKELSNYGMMIWGNINGNYGEASMGWNENSKSDFNWISYKNRGWNDPHLVGYMESHDEERLMFKNLSWGNADGSYNIQNLSTALARMELAGAFFFTIPGPKMIWQFGELGYDYSIDYNGRVGNKPILWDYYENVSRRRLYHVYAALIDLKKSEPAFSTEDFHLNVASATKRIELNHADMDVRIIGNFDVIDASVDPDFSQTGDWHDYFSGETVSITDVNGLITLAPGEYKIFTTKKLVQPVIIDKVEQEEVLESGTNIYPVPARETLYVSTASETKNISVFDINGRLVSQHNAAGMKQAVNIAGLTSGVYFLRVEFKNEQMEFLKFIKK